MIDYKKIEGKFLLSFDELIEFKDEFTNRISENSKKYKLRKKLYLLYLILAIDLFLYFMTDNVIALCFFPIFAIVIVQLVKYTIRSLLCFRYDKEQKKRNYQGVCFEIDYVGLRFNKNEKNMSEANIMWEENYQWDQIECMYDGKNFICFNNKYNKFFIIPKRIFDSTQLNLLKQFRTEKFRETSENTILFKRK